MPVEICECCGCEVAWTWEEAFDKFGFDDGDGLVHTETVATILRAAGYTVETTMWGLHNVIITSIEHHGLPQIPLDRIRLGYDCPRSYLPDTIVALLDDALIDID